MYKRQVIDQPAQEFIFGFRSSRKSYFNFLETQLDKELEKLQLFFEGHGHDERLVSISQVNAAPHGRLFNMILFYPVQALLGRREITRFILVIVFHFQFDSFLYPNKNTFAFYTDSCTRDEGSYSNFRGTTLIGLKAITKTHS